MSSAYQCVVSQQETGKMTASIVLRYVRFPTRRERLIQRVRGYLFLFFDVSLAWEPQHDESVSNVEHSSR